MKRYILPIAALFVGLATQAQTPDEEIDESYLTLATPPADLTTTTYHMEAFECSVGKNLDYQVQLGFAGNDVWIQGISEAFPESWVKGEMEGDRLIIDMDQYLGVYDLNGTNYNIWVTGINHDKARFEEPQFTYNPRTGIFTQIDGNWLVVNGSLTEWKWLNNMSDVMFSPVTDDEAITDRYALVVPPSDLVTHTFRASGHDYSFGAPQPVAAYDVELGLTSPPSVVTPAETHVYIRGLFADMPDAWIKGIITATPDLGPEPHVVLTLSSPQYLGKWYASLPCWLLGVDASESTTDVFFTYDAALGTFVQQADTYLYLNDTFATPSPMAIQMLGDITLEGDFAALLEGIHPLYSRNEGRDQPSSYGAAYDLTGRPANAASQHGVVIVDRRATLR